MVKGTSRRVIVVDSPDPKLFEQAIFIVRNDAFTQEGVTSQQVLGEACRIARGYAACQTRKPPLWRRLPLWVWLTVAAGALAGLAPGLLLAFWRGNKGGRSGWKKKGRAWAWLRGGARSLI